MDPLKKVIQTDQVRDYYFGSTIDPFKQLR